MKLNSKGIVQILVIAFIALLVGIIGTFSYFKLSTKTSTTPTSQATPTSTTSSTSGFTSQSPIPPPQNETVNWKTYIDSKIGFSIKYPADLYSAESDQIIGLGDVIKPSAVLTPTDQFNNKKPLAVTFKITISVEPKSLNLPSDIKDLFGQGPVTNYDPSLLSKKQIREIQISGVKAYRVDDLPIGQAGSTADVLFFNGNKFYEILVEPFQTSGDLTSNKKLTDQILSTFKFL